MDIELLRTFLEVKSTRHFGKAANSLFITQAAVSSRIKLLEQMLGTPLFVRYRNNLQLTETGDRLVAHAEDILLAWEHAKQDLTIRKNSKKVVRFGATTGFCAYVLEQNLTTIYKTVENISLRAESLDEETLIGRVRDRRLDLALLFDASKHVDFVSVPVSSAELVLVSTDPQASVSEVLNENYVSVDWGAFFAIKHQKLFPETSAPILQTTLSRIALQFILENGGGAFLPYSVVNSYLGKELHCVEGSPIIHQPLFAIFHEDSKYRAEIEQIIGIIRDSMTLHTTTLEALEEQLQSRDRRKSA